MPEMNGEETYRRMRAIDRSVPVLLMSGYTEQEASTYFGGQGTSGFIQKPFRLDELKEAVRRVLNDGGGPTAAPLARLSSVTPVGPAGPVTLASDGGCRPRKGQHHAPGFDYALRALLKNPGFSAVAILSLALAIGANTTIFTIVNAVLLRPLPYPDPDRLVVLNEVIADRSAPSTAIRRRRAIPRSSLSVHPASYVEWQARARAFEALALVQAPPLNVMGASGAEQISRLQTTADLYRVFGVRPVMGRGFTSDDTRPGADARIVILGYGFWQRWFGGDPGVLGRQLAIQDGSLTIIGVAPAGFRIGTNEPDAFTPLTIDPANPAATGSRAFECFGRLRPGVTLAAAQAEMTALAANVQAGAPVANPATTGTASSRVAGSGTAPSGTGASGAINASATRAGDRYGVAVSSLHDSLVREARPALRLLMAVVATVLAIACVNLAGLLMARGIGRRGEFALRAALGASRWRLIRQLAIESFVLSACGGAAGLAIAYWATQVLVAMSGGALTAGIAGPDRPRPRRRSSSPSRSRR